MSTEKGSPDFRTVVDENYGRVYNLLLRLVGDRDAAADLTQDTFVRACQAWSLFRGDCQVYTWLFRIAVNLARNYLDREGRERRREPGAPDDEADVRDPALTPDGEVETRELGSLLARELAALRTDQREIIVLRDVQGLSYEEIAEVLGCSVGAVKSKLFRARCVLRKRLSNYMGWEA